MPIYPLQEDPYLEHFQGIMPFVRKCGNDRRGRWALRGRRLLDYLLVYMKEGCGVFSLDRKSWVVREGDLFWIPPGHVTNLESRSSTMVCPFIHFDLLYRNPGSHWEMHIPEGMKDLSQWESCMHPPLPAGNAFSLLGGVYHMSRGDYICRLIEEICHDAAMMRPFFAAEQTGRMYLLLSQVLREVLCGSHGDEVLTSRLLRLTGYLENHIADATVSSCAAFCALSESYFRKVFSKIYGISPRDYLIRMRMRHAVELMMQTRLSITEIGQACGYRNSRNFSRIFSKIMGMPPLRYRRGIEPQQSIR